MTPMNKIPNLLPGDTIDEVEACRILNLTSRTMRKYRAKGLLPYHKLGNRIYYKWDDIVRLLGG